MNAAQTGQLEQAREHWRNGEIDAARAAYRELLAEQPGLADALIELGTLEREQGRFEQAIELHRQAADNTATAPAWTALGRSLADAGRGDDAGRRAQVSGGDPGSVPLSGRAPPSSSASAARVR